jgi:hypothetical protein
MNISKCSTRSRASEGVALGDVELPTWEAHPIASMPLPPCLDRFDLLPWSEIEKTLCEGSAVAIHAPGVDARTACATVDARLCIEDFLRYIVGDVLWVVHHAHCPFDGWARERIADENQAQKAELRRQAGEPPVILTPEDVARMEAKAASEADETDTDESEADAGESDHTDLLATVTKDGALARARQAVDTIGEAVNALRRAAPESVEAFAFLRAAAVAIEGLSLLAVRPSVTTAAAAERANQEEIVAV